MLVKEKALGSIPGREDKMLKKLPLMSEGDWVVLISEVQNEQAVLSITSINGCDGTFVYSRWITHQQHDVRFWKVHNWHAAYVHSDEHERINREPKKGMLHQKYHSDLLLFCKNEIQSLSQQILKRADRNSPYHESRSSNLFSAMTEFTISNCSVLFCFQDLLPSSHKELPKQIQIPAGQSHYTHIALNQSTCCW